MPCRIVCDRTNQILRAWFEGHVTDGELKDAYRIGQKLAPQIDPHAGITDFSDVTALSFTPETIQELAAAKPILLDPSRPVVFVAPIPHVYGMARMFETLGAATRPNVHVVRTLEEAYKILDVRDPQFEPI